MEIAIRRERKARSLKANAYMWGVVYQTIAEWSGHDEDELHEYFKGKFLRPVERVLPSGEVIEVPGSTASLSTEEFSEYVSKVKRWAGEQGVHVPEPDEVEVGL